MLIGNYSVLQKSPARFLSGSSVSDTRSNFNKNGMNRNFEVGWASVSNQTSKSARPNGNLAPSAWVLPRVAGGMSSYLTGIGLVSGLGAMGLNAVADLTGSGDITNAPLELIVSASADLTGSGSLVADILGVASASADLTGTGTVSSANLIASGNIGAGLSGSGTLDITSYARGLMTCDIIVGSQLDSPLDEIVEGALTARQSLRLLLAQSMGLTDKTGDVVTFRDTTNTKDRIVATVVASERTSVTLDPS